MSASRTQSAAVAVAAAGLLLTGCSGTKASSKSPAVTVTVVAPSSSPPTSASGPASASAPAPSTSAPAPPANPPAPPAPPTPPAPPPTPAGPQPCTTAGLSITEAEIQGTAGSVYEALLFTNTSSSSCTLTGYPGVSFVGGGDGHQVGAAATRQGTKPEQTVTLAPSAQASAKLRITQTRNQDPARCKPEPTRGLRIYPPGEKAAAFVDGGGLTAACSAGEPQLSVSAVVAGPG